MEETRTCKYCGQVLMGNQWCDCDGACAERKAAEVAELAAEEIRCVFGGNADKGFLPVSEENIQKLQELAKLAAFGQIRDITIILREGVKAKIRRTASGSLKIERSETRKDGTEVG